MSLFSPTFYRSPTMTLKDLLIGIPACLLLSAITQAATASFVQKTTDAKGIPVYQFSYTCVSGIKGDIYVKASSNTEAQVQAQKDSVVACEEQRASLPIGAPKKQK